MSKRKQHLVLAALFAAALALAIAAWTVQALRFAVARPAPAA